MSRNVYVKKVTIGVEPNEETVGLCLNMHAMALLQDKYGAEFDLRDALKAGSLKEIGDLVRIFLEGWRLRHDPERPEFTLKDAYDVVDNMGGINELAAALNDLMDNSLSPEARRIAEERVKRAMEEDAADPEGAGADPTTATAAGPPSKARPSRRA